MDFSLIITSQGGATQLTGTPHSGTFSLGPAAPGRRPPDATDHCSGPSLLKGNEIVSRAEGGHG